MKNRALIFTIVFLVSQCSFGQQPGIHFTSTDTLMEKSFSWAKDMALHYQGVSGGPVGRWYESALPPRYAFCMRDVSHQCIGAEILGMRRENNNMFRKFTANISKSKDWCSYWEIDKYNRPSPADYRNDREFWYNLNANFDLMDACWRLYLWTGDSTYINDPVFLNFFDKTVHEYIVKWILQPDSLLTRPPYPNAPVPFNAEDAFNRCRGLPSYSEGIPNLKMGVDLVAAIYRGLISYSNMLAVRGKDNESDQFRKLAYEYQQHLENQWWDAELLLYNTHFTNENKFGKAEGETFLLWFDALDDAARKKYTINHLLSMNLNVENLSYLPLQYYRNAYSDKARSLILHLTDPSTLRKEYPEVSYGVVEAIVQGLMGVDVNAANRTISTIYRGNDGAESQLTGLPVLNTEMTISHIGKNKSTITNTGTSKFIWKAMFFGKFATAYLSLNKSATLLSAKDKEWGDISYLEINVNPGETYLVVVK